LRRIAKAGADVAKPLYSMLYRYNDIELISRASLTKSSIFALFCILRGDCTGPRLDSWLTENSAFFQLGVSLLSGSDGILWYIPLSERFHREACSQDKAFGLVAPKPN
jgi:hypothetical protein